MLYKSIKIDTIIYLIFNIIAMCILAMGGMEKYLFVIALSGFLFCVMKKNLSNRDALAFCLPWVFYIILGMFLCIYQQNFANNTFKQSLLYLVPFLMAFTIAHYFKQHMSSFVDTLFWATLAVFFLTGIKSFTRANLMESQYAFTLGLFALYFLYYRKFWNLLPCLVGLYLGNKRIALVAMLAVVAYYCFMSMIKKEKTKRRWVTLIYTLMILAIEGYIFIIRSGWLNKMFSRFSINSMGRMNIYGQMEQYYTYGIDYVGTGIGMVQGYVSQLGYASYQLLHSDLLSMYIEMGFVGFLVFFIIYGHILLIRSKKWKTETTVFVMGVIIYTFLLFATDNISIYINYFYPFYIIVFAVISNLRSQENGKKR